MTLVVTSSEKAHRVPAIEVIDEPEARQRSPRNPNTIIELDDGSESEDEAEEVVYIDGVSKKVRDADKAKLGTQTHPSMPSGC